MLFLNQSETQKWTRGASHIALIGWENGMRFLNQSTMQDCNYFWHSLKLLLRYQGQLSNPFIFLKQELHSTLLSRINDIYNASLSRKHLTLQARKPEAIKTFEPKFEEQ